jgi:hypothetical protein
LHRFQLAFPDLAEHIGLLNWEADLTGSELLYLAGTRDLMFRTASEDRLADWQQAIFFSQGDSDHQLALAACRTGRQRALLELERELTLIP